MLSFEWAICAIALVLPFIILLLPKDNTVRTPALKLPSSGGAWQYALQDQSVDKQSLLATFIALLAYACLVLACMRPVWVSDNVTLPTQGRDIMLAIDLSGSMRAEDMLYQSTRVSRLFVTKKVAVNFVKNRTGDRVGLVVFGAYAYLQTPLTFDRNTVIDNIKNSYLHDADDVNNSVLGTSIGDAIGIALEQLKQESNLDKMQHKTLILLTDGKDMSSQIPPLKAAELAAQNHLKIYTIGLGSQRRGLFFGRQQEIDEPTLKAIAKMTGGKFYRARQSDELKSIYAQIDKLEPINTESLNFKPQRSLFYIPLGVSILLWVWLLVYLYVLPRRIKKGLDHE